MTKMNVLDISGILKIVEEAKIEGEKIEGKKDIFHPYFAGSANTEEGRYIPDISIVLTGTSGDGYHLSPFCSRHIASLFYEMQNKSWVFVDSFFGVETEIREKLKKIAEQIEEQTKIPLLYVYDVKR